MRVTVNIDNATTVKLALSEADLRELTALWELQKVKNERGSLTYDLAEIIKITEDSYLSVTVESDYNHYPMEVRG